MTANTWESFRTAVAAAVVSAMPSSVSAPANNDGPDVSWIDGPAAIAKHVITLSEVSTVIEMDRDSALGSGGAQSLSSFVAITVQVQCESIHDDPTLNAQWLVEQVRLGLRRVSVREALAAANIVIANFPGATTRRGYTADGRTVSAASFDVVFRTEFAFASGEDAGLIEHVEAEGGDDLEGVTIAVDDPDPEP